MGKNVRRRDPVRATPGGEVRFVFGAFGASAGETPQGTGGNLRRRGVQKRPTKQLVSLRIDRDVLAAYRATGPGWQRRANQALRAYAEFLRLHIDSTSVTSC